MAANRRSLSQREAAYLAEQLGARNPEAITRAMGELMLEFADEGDMVVEFFELLATYGGDLTQILDKTHEPVSIERFITDDYFLAKAFDQTLWPRVEETLIEIIEGGYIEALLMGAIGIAKTTIATVVNAYYLYCLSCEKHPQLRYGLMPTTDITFAMLNKTDQLARDVTYARFRSLIESSPYFAEHFPHDYGREKKMSFRNHIDVLYAAADSEKLLGMNVMSGIADEMNFMARVEKSKRNPTGGMYDQAKTIYNALVRRRKSRFEAAGKLPGCICVVSSKGYPGDFTEERKREVEAQNETTTYLYDHAQWDILPAQRPDGSQRFCGDEFRIDLGDVQHNARILKADEEPRPGCEVLDVPVEFLSDFQKDMEGSLRDFAGIATLSTRPYFYDRERVWGMADHFEQMGGRRLFGDLEITNMNAGLPYAETGHEVLHPDCYRAAHIDLAQTGDRCGIAVGHIWQTTDTRVADRVAGSSSVETQPHVMYDLLLAYEAPPGGEIEFSVVRALLYYLRDELGIPIKWVSFDGFQSVDSRQILRRKGFKAKTLSVEGKEAYETLRTAIWQQRVAAPEHGLCFNELCRLEQDPKTQRIDHPADFSKDVSDAMAGVYQSLVTKRMAFRAAPAVPPAEEDDTEEGDDPGAQQAVQERAAEHPDDIEHAESLRQESETNRNKPAPRRQRPGATRRRGVRRR